MNNSVMAYTVRTAQYRYHEYRNKKTGKVIAQELYDMNKDPLQYVNLANEENKKEIVVRHMQLLKDGWKSALPE
jgi:iduronate 2-sulfatase